jgi:hypothetical protein
LDRNWVWFLTFEENREGTPDAAQGHPLPRRSARAATALEALLLLSCPIIRGVCRSALSSPRGIPQSRLLALRDITPLPIICPVPRDQLWPAIGGRLLGLPPHPRGEIRMRNDWPLVLLSVPFPWRRQATCRRDAHARSGARSSWRTSPARLLPNTSEQPSMKRT